MTEEDKPWHDKSVPVLAICGQKNGHNMLLTQELVLPDAGSRSVSTEEEHQKEV